MQFDGRISREKEGEVVIRGVDRTGFAEGKNKPHLPHVLLRKHLDCLLAR